MHQYAVSNPTIASSIFFPNKGAGEEASGVQNCDHFQPVENSTHSSKPPECVLVPFISLGVFAATHLSNVLKIHHLLIDTEGSDYLVLQGGLKTLNRTRYLEFEVNAMGLWLNQSLFEAIEYLDRHNSIVTGLELDTCGKLLDVNYLYTTLARIGPI